jgi:hypothetical protein
MQRQWQAERERHAQEVAALRVELSSVLEKNITLQKLQNKLVKAVVGPSSRG